MPLRSRCAAPLNSNSSPACSPGELSSRARGGRLGTTQRRRPIFYLRPARASNSLTAAYGSFLRSATSWARACSVFSPCGLPSTRSSKRASSSSTSRCFQCSIFLEWRSRVCWKSPRQSAISAGGARQATQEAARGHRTDVDASIGGVTLHPDAVTQNRAAGERAGGIDGDDADSLLLLPVEGGQTIHQRAFARTGSPSDAGQIGLSGRRKKASQDLDGSRVAVFDGGNGARDRADVTGANLVGPVVNSDAHKGEA